MDSKAHIPHSISWEFNWEEKPRKDLSPERSWLENSTSNCGKWFSKISRSFPESLKNQVWQNRNKDLKESLRRKEDLREYLIKYGLEGESCKKKGNTKKKAKVAQEAESQYINCICTMTIINNPFDFSPFKTNSYSQSPNNLVLDANSSKVQLTSLGWGIRAAELEKIIPNPRKWKIKDILFMKLFFFKKHIT